MTPLFSIIIPTWNNPQYLNPCLNSIIRTGVLGGLAEVVVVNNGKQPIQDEYGHIKNLRVLEPGENLGWERGLEYGLKNTDSKYVCFQNDDTYIPSANSNVYHQLLYPFSDSNVAAVGPATTMASGWHSIYMANPLRWRTEVSYLIFFTVMVRRSHLLEAGGIDTSCPGGDDFDLSIRLRKIGKKLIVNPAAFLIHHGFKTGERVRGGPDVAGGWNSKEMTDATNKWLIQKHGFKTYLETIRGLRVEVAPMEVDNEGRLVRQLVDGAKVYELGCGYRKTIETAIAIDIVPKGEPIPHVPGGLSVADVVADVSKELPIASLTADTVIARHVLEHCVDTVATLREWGRILKMGGRLIIAVPNQDTCNSIPLNPEHVHAFSPESLKNLMELIGFKQVIWQDPENGISFVGCYEKVLHHMDATNGKALETANA